MAKLTGCERPKRRLRCRTKVQLKTRRCGRLIHSYGAGCAIRGANRKRFSPSRLREEEEPMSDLGIFSLLVVGRDLPPAFIPTSGGADYRPVDRTIPITQQRNSFRGKLPNADQSSQTRARTVS